MKRIRFYIAALALLLAFGTPGSAHAANCSSPTKPEGTINYNPTYHAMEFCNGTTWISMGGGAPPAGALTFLSTQTASASASLQFTNLPTSYNTLFLNCAGLLTSGTAALYSYVGEGAGPTWKTGANYTIEGEYASNASSGIINTTTGPDLTNAGTSNNNTSVPASLKMYIDNVGSSTKVKMATLQGYVVYIGNNVWIGYESFWNADTNPITGLEIVPSSGTITSGTCSLYGMN